VDVGACPRLEAEPERCALATPAEGLDDARRLPRRGAREADDEALALDRLAARDRGEEQEPGEEAEEAA